MKNIKATKWLAIALATIIVGCGPSKKSYEHNMAVEEASLEMPYEEPVILPEEGGNKFESYDENPFVDVAKQPTSTFSIDADGASYAIMRRYVSDGMNIPSESVRIEEFLNYFTFDYPSPTDGNSVAINAEVGECPWNTDHKLLRLGVKGKELNEDEVPQANFVFLVDVSGSMDSEDKLELLKSGLVKLLDHLNPDDRISLVTYSGQVEKILESTPVSEKSKIKKAIMQLDTEGFTAGGEALRMAYEEALANYNPKYNNRVIMGTDGDFNVGVTDDASLVEMVEKYASKGIYMTCLGFGSGNLNDSMMEKISNAGNGTYYYIDSEKEMMKVFVDERERFVSVANDAKCQVSFDKKMVSQYRLIGYENRMLENKDFKDDKKDAGEIGAGQTITALYEIVPTKEFMQTIKNGSRAKHVVATFDFRYKKSLNSSSIPLKVDVTVEDLMSNGVIKPLSDNMSFAAGVAAFGMVLRSSKHKGNATMDMAVELVEKGLGYDPHHYRADFLSIIKQLKIKRPNGMEEPENDY